MTTSDMPPAASVQILCAEVASARGALAADPTAYHAAVVLQIARRNLAAEVNRVRSTFRMIKGGKS